MVWYLVKHKDNCTPNRIFCVNCTLKIETVGSSDVTLGYSLNDYITYASPWKSWVFIKQNFVLKCLKFHSYST
jgi:hypothetical protein